MTARRPLLVLPLVAVALAATGCEAKSDADRQFDAARLRAATALTKVDPGLGAGAVETIVRTTVVSTSTPRAVSDVARLEPLDGGTGWEVVVRVELEDDGGLLGGSSTEGRCYAFALDAGAEPVGELPSTVVPCEPGG